MNDCRCMVCKYLGDHASKELVKDHIYRDKGPHLIVSLCYHHSWELFRMGQRKFLNQYRENFMQVFGTETEEELINHLKGNNKHGFQAWAA